ncbi:hypothetical protein Drorol1_Dr00022971, partial [Drosera rotundifolia]
TNHSNPAAPVTPRWGSEVGPAPELIRPARWQQPAAKWRQPVTTMKMKRGGGAVIYFAFLYYTEKAADKEEETTGNITSDGDLFLNGNEAGSAPSGCENNDTPVASS